MLRTNINNKPFDNQKVRNALQLAVDNATVLKLGYNDAVARSARNHHVCPIHPEYFELPKITRDIAKRQGADDRGRPGWTTSSSSSPDDAEYVKNPGDVIAAPDAARPASR
mgnify:CR=1 FL=1